MSPEITEDPVFQESAEPKVEEKESAGSILQVSRPGVTRYKRSAVIAGGSVLAVAVCIGLISAFAIDHKKKGTEDGQDDQVNLLAQTKPDVVNDLPDTYTDAAATGDPGEGPGTATLPADDQTSAANAALANSAQQAPPAYQQGYQRPPMTPAQERAARAREAAIQQEMAARSGGIMFDGNSAALRDAGSTAQSFSTRGQDDDGTDRSATAGQPAQGQAGDSRQQFIATAGIDEDYVKGSLQAPRSRYEVKAGTTIAGALLTALNSDLPGEVVAQVTENVYDHVTGRYVLIPQGSRLIGRYDSKVSYKQTRALVVWNRIIFPNGNSINIGTMTGTDGAGAAGVRDRVNNHWGGKLTGITLSTALAIGAAIADNAGTRDNQIISSGGGAASQQASQIGGKIVDRELDRQPTITVRPGFKVRVLVSKDIPLAPYPVSRTRRR